MQTTQPTFCPTRRAVLAALPGIAILPVAVACGTTSKTDDSSSGSTPANDTSSNGTSGGGTAPGGGARIPVAQVPVGSAVVIAGAKPYVVAQPTDGAFVAFDAACTHQGVTVAAQDGLSLQCPAHGSKFNGGTGAVEGGPAKTALASVPVRRDGENLVVG
ncbi:Rieske (2Fe-2S) protein [Tsukamurella sp. M9C]|uniref:Rieske (2Fe-2S) protein n=1 Tax=unclassified Tsukamurella TaxID=2633480 RepID=UPI001CCF4FB8|nr:Rieske (2Fe-2S) protein [Tsukamurella sp. M9C]MCA0156714.1 Rieske (2Fe-2S) protein [Tsukamurella sp. M9C]